MNLKQLYFFSAIFFFIISSCRPTYIPNITNIPLLQNKNEMQLSVHLSNSSVEPQFAFSPTKHFGIMINGSLKVHDKFAINKHPSNHQFAEVAIAYLFNDYEKNNNKIFELWAAYGYAHFNNYFSLNNIEGMFPGHYNRFFLQPTIGLSSEVGDFGFALRVSYLDLHVNKSMLNNKEIHLEPGIIARTDINKYIYLCCQAGISYPLLNKNQLIYDYKMFTASIGFMIKFNSKTNN